MKIKDCFLMFHNFQIKTENMSEKSKIDVTDM